MVWWAWSLIGWTVLSAVLAVVFGLALREADRRERGPAPVPAGATDRPAAPRRRVPAPAVAVPLAGLGVALEAVGFAVRAAGAERGTGRLFAMDLPMSVPRLYVTALLVAAAGAALLGAARAGSRRPWWTAVGLVTALLAAVKAGGTVHVRAVAAAGVADRPVLAALGSALVGAAVLGALWWLSRADRRDRRRVLAALGLYLLAAVGLSGVSSLVGQALGASTWTALATFVEESGEVVGGVAVLMAVLIGVAPRLVLPADWPLRRAADAETIDAPAAVPVRTRIRY